mmetsp:Transcript_7280/g.17091  ORF Transcript_7280/g.17091 Transcript_7280/m.17091 type:complete len:343 (+) Transcript_7280:237-1265(+)
MRGVRINNEGRLTNEGSRVVCGFENRSTQIARLLKRRTRLEERECGSIGRGCERVKLGESNAFDLALLQAGEDPSQRDQRPVTEALLWHVHEQDRTVPDVPESILLHKVRATQDVHPPAIAHGNAVPEALQHPVHRSTHLPLRGTKPFRCSHAPLGNTRNRPIHCVNLPLAVQQHLSELGFRVPVVRDVIAAVICQLVPFPNTLLQKVLMSIHVVRNDEEGAFRIEFLKQRYYFLCQRFASPRSIVDGQRNVSSHTVTSVVPYCFGAPAREHSRNRNHHGRGWQADQPPESSNYKAYRLRVDFLGNLGVGAKDPTPCSAREQNVSEVQQRNTHQEQHAYCCE